MVDINSADTGASIAHERKIAAFRWRTLNAEVVTRRSAFRLPLPRASSRNSSFQSCSVVLAGYFWDLISGFDVELLDDRTAEILAKRLTNFSARAINRDSKHGVRIFETLIETRLRKNQERKEYDEAFPHLERL